MKSVPIYQVILIVGLAFALRVYKSGAYGIFLDEKYTMIISQGVVMDGANQKDVFFTPGKTYFTPAEFWKEKTFDDFIEANIRGDIGNSPFYYGVLWVWMKIFGLSDFSARFPSVLFSTLTVGLLYIFVRKHFKSPPLALLSAFLAAIEPFFIAYSHQARNYSLSFFLTLLATHLFLLIVENYGKKAPGKRPDTGLLLGYGLVFIASLLSHYLAITVFLCHALYALFFLRPPRRWLPFLYVAIAGLGLVSLWFLFGGGKYTFQTLAYQGKLYGELARTNPYDNPYAVILPATFANLATKSAPIWADLVILFNGLGQIEALGIRNIAIAFFGGLLAMTVLHLALRRADFQWGWALGFALLLVAGMPFYTVAKPEYVVAAAAPSFLYLLFVYLKRYANPANKPLLWFMLALAVVPTLFLILMSVKNDHTYGLTQRYSGFSFPYSIVFVAMILRQWWSMPIPFRAVLGVVLLIQASALIGLLGRIYGDISPKYTYFATARVANPYILTAQRIESNYTPGDTVLYPTVKLYPRDSIEKTFFPYSIQDAQLTNLYLPKDATYCQRLDTTQSDRVILIKGGSGERKTLFDFKGNKYRY